MDDFRHAVDLDRLAGDDTIALARTAAEAIRGLNHATRHENGLGQPSVPGLIEGGQCRLPVLPGRVGLVERACVGVAEGVGVGGGGGGGVLGGVGGGELAGGRVYQRAPMSTPPVAVSVYPDW